MSAQTGDEVLAASGTALMALLSLTDALAEIQRLRHELDLERRQRQAYAAQVDLLTQHPDDLASLLRAALDEVGELRKEAS